MTQPNLLKRAVKAACTTACAVAAWGVIASPAARADQHTADASLKLKWTYETDKPVNLAPVVAGDRVATIPGDTDLIALDARTGQLVWKYSPDEGLWQRGITSYGYRYFVCLKGGKIAAVDARDGRELWKTDIGMNCQRPAHFSHGAMYVSTTLVGPGLPGTPPLTGAKLVSLDPETGAVNWEHETKAYLLQTAYRHGDTVYSGGSYRDPEFDKEEGGPAHYFALDAETGRLKWVHEDIEGLPKAIYATQDRMLYVPYEDYVFALDAADGTPVWKRDSENWTPSMIGHADRVYFGAANTYVHAWAAKDGEPLWEFNIPGAAFDYLLIKPTLSDGRLYFMSQRGTVYALDPDTGNEVMPAFKTGMISRVNPTFHHGWAYMGDQDGRLYGYEIVK